MASPWSLVGPLMRGSCAGERFHLGKIFERVVVKDSDDGIADFPHHILQRAVIGLGVGAVATFLIGCSTHARDRCEWTVHDADHLSESDLPWLFDEAVPSAYAAVAGEEAGVLEGEEDMLKELERDMLFLGNVSAEQGRATVMVGEFD